MHPRDPRQVAQAPRGVPGLPAPSRARGADQEADRKLIATKWGRQGARAVAAAAVSEIDWRCQLEVAAVRRLGLAPDLVGTFHRGLLALSLDPRMWGVVDVWSLGCCARVVGRVGWPL